MLKEREKRVLEFMKKEIFERGFPPTVREICTALGIKSTSTVHKDIASLERQGYLKKDPAKPRALLIMDPETGERTGPQAVSGESDSYVSHGTYAGDVERTDIVDVPVVGRIAAGTPTLAEQNIEDRFPVPARFVEGGDNFMLTVKGESMIGVGIMDGDYILVEQQQTARNGEIVVAMVDGFESEATVKTFYKEDGHIRLQPENPEMSPIIVNDVRIVGKVKGVFRYFN